MNTGAQAKTKADILIVDDEEDIRSLIQGILSDEGYAVRQAASAREAYKSLEGALPDLVILDIWLQGSEQDGLQILERIKADHPLLPVLMISGHGTIETAVHAIKLGAYDFIEKPFKSDRLLLMMNRALEAAALRKENVALRQRVNREQALIGASPSLQNLKSLIEKIAPTKSRVLVRGPAGTGKSLVARAIHARSPKADAPFIAIGGAEFQNFNWQNLPDVCTVFLDEVSDIPADGQGRLIRLLQEQDGARDIRVISSSSRNLELEIKKGTFREDLYYRLNVMTVDVPALSERKQDIPALIHHFAKELAESSGLSPRVFTEAAFMTLQSYAWPGNIRQLKNVIEWSMIMASAKPAEYEIGPGDLPPDLARQSEGQNGASMGSAEMMLLPLREAREFFEKEYLAEQMRRFDSNVSRTAQFIGMERSALHRKLKSLDLLGTGETETADDERPFKKAKA